MPFSMCREKLLERSPLCRKAIATGVDVTLVEIHRRVGLDPFSKETATELCSRELFPIHWECLKAVGAIVACNHGFRIDKKGDVWLRANAKKYARTEG